MSFEQALIAAVGALWVALSSFGVGAIKYLVSDRTTRDAEWQRRLTTEETRCNERITKLEAKLDVSADLLTRQNESMQRQIDVQQQTISALQALAKGPSG